MEGPEVTFLFQFGSVRDAVCVPAIALTLKTLKDLACDFINTKVRAAIIPPLYVGLGTAILSIECLL